MTEISYINYLKIFKGLLKNAATTDDKKDFENSLKRAASLTRKFESYLKEASEYSEEQSATTALDNLLSGLQAISRQDFKAGKLQAEFVEKSIAKEYNNLLKASNK
jgi:23S rRNA-/tRNA-specific pseudouridylate synthase